MSKKINKKLVIVLSLSVSFFTAHGISNKTANIATTCIAILSAGGCGYSWYTIPELQKIQPVFFAVTSLIATGTAYNFLHSITPAGRIKRANVLLNKLLRHRLVKISFDRKGDFFDAVHDRFLQEDLPLISAYHYIVSLLPMMHRAFRLINKAAAEADKNVVLRKKYNASLVCAKKIFKNMSVALKRIREHKNYLSQLTIYKEFLNNTKQTIAQEQMAHAQVQIAHAQQGYTLLKWIKWILPI